MTFFPPPSSESERLTWLRLFRTSGIGPVKFGSLLQTHGSATNALCFLEEQVKKGKTFGIPSLEEVHQEWELHEKKGATLIFKGDPSYPQNLLFMEDAPPILSQKGRPLSPHPPLVSIVGARNASSNGQYFAQKIAQELGQKGVKVVSGMARGIDAAAHRGSLESGTIAILAGGIDVIYPLENTSLYHQLCEKGTLFSEIKIGTSPQASHFPRRNRLISGLSDAVALIEAGIHSGSMITAEFALAQGKEVFAAPGFPLDPRCHGCHTLLREGAPLLTSAQDILQFFEDKQKFSFSDYEVSPPLISTSRPEKEEGSLETSILEKLGSTPVSIDVLIRSSPNSTSQVLQAISSLELSGKVKRLWGARIVRQWAAES